MNKPRVLVAMSGGVDSSVAAALLQDEGYDVAGAIIQVWISPRCGNKNTNACCGISGVRDARSVANRLQIPFHVFHFEEAFKREVVDRFAEEYAKGRTPNPCLSCNEHIKFALFYEKAREMGFDLIATGHYAQVVNDPGTGALCIAEGKDPAKDQSYVLFPLQKDLLSHLLLPVGSFTKKEIRARAATLGLSVKDKPDSQEICFVPQDDYGSFLEQEFGKPALPPGVIRDRAGKVLGTHPGYYHFTRGQRRGLGVAFSERLYVVETRPETNEVIVGTKEEIVNHAFEVSRMHWFLEPSSNPFRADVKIRSHHQRAPAQITVLENQTARIVFDEPQDAITPGQAAVFYEGPRVMGGGWIDSILDAQEKT